MIVVKTKRSPRNNQSFRVQQEFWNFVYTLSCSKGYGQDHIEIPHQNFALEAQGWCMKCFLDF